MSDKFEPVENQMYRAEITDQGTTESKNGTPIVKVYCRLLGKPGVGNPDDVTDPIAAGRRPEVEVVSFLDETSEQCGFRVRDLVENLGWDPADGIEKLDPRTPDYLNVTGKRVNVVAVFKGEKTYWNFARGEKKLKRFVGDKPVENLKAKKAGVLQRYLDLQNKKNDGVPAGTGEAIPF